MAAGDGRSDLYQQLVIDASLSLSDFFVLKRSLLLSASDDEKEAAFSELVELTCRFPNDFLSDQQVGLLLDFFLGAFESSTVTAPYAIRGIHHLVLNSKNLPSGLETPLVQIMFRDGNVQGWDLEKRLLQYNIMEWLLVHRLKGVDELVPHLSRKITALVSPSAGYCMSLYRPGHQIRRWAATFRQIKSQGTSSSASFSCFLPNKSA